MNSGKQDPLAYFALKAIQEASVSEIREATLSSGIPALDRVNFHIGDPVQDNRLTRLYKHLISGLELSSISLERQDPLLSDDLEDFQQEQMRLLFQAVDQSVAYLPSGGFSASSPGLLTEKIKDWLKNQQEEPLDYDLGIESGLRELTFVSGGKWEALRVFFTSLCWHLKFLPAYLHAFKLEVPKLLWEWKDIQLDFLSNDEVTTLHELESALESFPEHPHFMILGDLPSENHRRQLRRISLYHPLFFIEANDAPNHKSLAREAGMSERVLRILTPESFHPSLARQSLAVVAGNAEFIKIIESTHFKIKGTPAAPEIHLLAFMMDKMIRDESGGETEGYNDWKTDQIKPLMEYYQVPFLSTVKRSVSNITRIAGQVDLALERMLNPVINIGEHHKIIEMSTPFSGMTIQEIVREFFSNISNPTWHRLLERAFISAFLKHHPEYQSFSTQVVSGSARTALGILGFHCGISEVVISDLSWTYNHCFPSVVVVPLKMDQSLDVEAIKDRISQLLENNPRWFEKGALIINNPHNASGQIFSEGDVTALIKWLMHRNISIIDDLSYQNIRPVNEGVNIRTVRQIALDLVKSGYIGQDQLKNIITIHSLSKTDCFAGGRLAVAEIPDKGLMEKFRKINQTIKPNVFSLLLAYLFYRRNTAQVKSFWLLRNKILSERMKAIQSALHELPTERNPFKIHINPPKGSMYPQLVINQLPEGISLDWLSFQLATRGIGIIPLTTFARTARGFELARKAFRLTLGGSDDANVLQRKTRRLLIDLNRIIAEEAANYTIKELKGPPVLVQFQRSLSQVEQIWLTVEGELKKRCNFHLKALKKALRRTREINLDHLFFQYLGKTMDMIHYQLLNRLELWEMLQDRLGTRQKNFILDRLEIELKGESLSQRQHRFQSRLFDRTVHPTQMYSLEVKNNSYRLIDSIIKQRSMPSNFLDHLARDMVGEFFGINVPINSKKEAEELVNDLRVLAEAEEWSSLKYKQKLFPLLSFWGDWDGSTRPSGQGHRLAAAPLLENVTRLTNLVSSLLKAGVPLKIDPELVNEMNALDIRNRKFWQLLNNITDLTGQLEKRYLTVLPFDTQTGIWRRLGMKLKVTHDPVAVLWQHNDHLENRMLKLRKARSINLEYYFKLNLKLKQVLLENLEVVNKGFHDQNAIMRTASFSDVVKRFVLTPRIHQKMILSRDQFAIDTTVHNMTEINHLSAQSGIPGMILGIQISMSTDPEALILLDRKIRSEREEMMRKRGGTPIPPIWVIPLFEDVKTVQALEDYLDRVWEYSMLSRTMEQDTADRFNEIVCECFLAGSDLSQQVSQQAGSALYRQSKFKIVRWLAKKGLVGKVRIKLGSGEPAQRQGGYYDVQSGRPIITDIYESHRPLKQKVGDAKFSALKFARSPLRGIMAGGEFRTFQSNLFEHLSRMGIDQRANVLFHLKKSQERFERELIRAAEPLKETRLRFYERGMHELEMLTVGQKDEIYLEFIDLLQNNFRQILYGQDEDVVGIHAISYFVSRVIPPLRDRPVVRHSGETRKHKGREMFQKIAQTLPMSKHGSMLRAIGHNRAQTVILGLNQLTTGLFRALAEFVKIPRKGKNNLKLVEKNILPRLPVRDILHTLRIYQNPEGKYIKLLETSFPAYHSSFLAIHEDRNAMPTFIPMMQRELLRRTGLEVEGFFIDTQILPELLPVLRPDLAVLLQPDLFNTSNVFSSADPGRGVGREWEKEVKRLLNIPVQMSKWRGKIWNIISQPIQVQVKSFVELALAIHTLTLGDGTETASFTTESAKVLRLGSQVADLLRGAVDDSMRQFLITAVQYLTQVPKNLAEVPIEILHALRDVERIVKIEEQALSPDDQKLVQFYSLQMARLAGENG